MSAQSPKAFAEERRAAILDMLEHNASIQVAEIATTFGVSSVTARADLDALEQAGKLRRTHGGAVSLHKRLTVSTQDKRVNVNAAAKRRIAVKALEYIHNGDTLLIDSGTTSLEFVRVLGGLSGITVITADITIADYIDESLPAVDVIMLGGTLRKGHRYLYGPLTLKALEQLHADMAIVTPGAFIPGRGFMTDYPQMAELKHALFENADNNLVLLDASKVGGHGIYTFATLDECDVLIMDVDPKGKVTAAIEVLEEDARPTLMLA